MQMFALTMFKAFPPATPYQTAIFLDFFWQFGRSSPATQPARSIKPPTPAKYVYRHASKHPIFRPQRIHISHHPLHVSTVRKPPGRHIHETLTPTH